MELNNGTSDPVDYEQQGSGPQGEDLPVKGMLSPVDTPGAQANFPPSGPAPYRVIFRFPPGVKVPERIAIARDVPHDDSVVTLCPDWTTAVDSECGS